MISAIVTTLPIDGVADRDRHRRAGKMGKVYAYRADDGKPPVDASPSAGTQHDTGPLPRKPVAVYPRRTRRRRDADGARRRAACSSPGSTSPTRASATASRAARPASRRPRRPDGARRRHRQGGLAAPAAVDRLRRGHGRQRRRLHEHLRRHDLRLRRPRRARRSGRPRRARGSTPSRPSPATCCSSAPPRPASSSTRASSWSPTRS